MGLSLQGSRTTLASVEIKIHKFLNSKMNHMGLKLLLSEILKLENLKSLKLDLTEYSSP